MRRRSWWQRRSGYLLFGSIVLCALIGGRVGNVVTLVYCGLLIAGLLIWIALTPRRDRRRGFEVIIPRR